MEPVSRFLWLCGDVALVVLVYRGARAQLLRRYVYFYIYIFSVLCQEAARLAAARNDATYAIVYWVSEFITAAMGFGVTWEIYRDVLMPYDGVRRMARALLSSLLSLILARALVELGGNPRHYQTTTLDLVRNLGVGQAVLLIGVIGLIAHYGIPMGRNLRWMLFGYGAYVGTNIITRTIQAQSGNAGAHWWTLPTQLEYCGTLIAWCAGVWSYHPNPVPDLAMERDYERISRQTARAFGRLRSHLIQSWRS